MTFSKVLNASVPRPLSLVARDLVQIPAIGPGQAFWPQSVLLHGMIVCMFQSKLTATISEPKPESGLKRWNGKSCECGA